LRLPGEDPALPLKHLLKPKNFLAPLLVASFLNGPVTLAQTIMIDPDSAAVNPTLAQGTRIDPTAGAADPALTKGTEIDPIIAAPADLLAQNTRIDASGAGGGSLDGLSNAIFQKEIQLAKLTTTYRFHNTHETRLHKWLTAVVSTAAYSTADAGNIITFTNAFKYHHQPQNLAVGRAELGPFLIFMGELLFVGRTLSISAIDYYHDRQIHHQGFDRATFERNVGGLKTDITRMLEQRRQLVASSGDPAAVQEQAVLQDISDGLTTEFVRNYARASRIRSMHLTENIVNNYTAGTGAFCGGLLIYLAASNSNPRLTLPAGIGFISSGVGFMAKDFLARRVSQHVEKKTTAKMLAKNPAQADPIKNLEQDNIKLATADSGGAQRRRQGYDCMLKALHKDVTLSKVENKEEWHKYIHDQSINTAEGLANIAAGSILAQAGWQYRPVSADVNPFLRLDRGENFLGKFGAAAVTFTPTASGGVADTPIEAFYGEYKKRKDCREGVCPKVGFEERMSLLDQAETSIK
jgi:hypothetical protein